MKPTVYIETSVISYRTARPSRDLIVAGHQQLTEDWWRDVLPDCEPFISQVVLDEISQGDPEPARKRLEAVRGFAVLEVTAEAVELADVYLDALNFPGRLRADCYHLALASWHGMEYLLTWNCTHIASGPVRRRIEDVNSARGVGAPTICTPEELMVI